MKTANHGGGRHNRSGSGGSSTISQQHPGGLAEFAVSILVAAHIPANEQVCNTVWVNQHGNKMQRQVIGNKVLIRQQPAAPPRSPEILVLSDEMLSNFKNPDKYIKCLAMFGYTFSNYSQDIRDELIDVNFEYILFFLGTMQLGVFDPQKLMREITQVMHSIVAVNDKSLVIFCGVAPRPLDHHRSRARCVNYNKALVSVVDQLRWDRGWNCTALDIYDNFIQGERSIVQPLVNFQDELYFTEVGVRLIQAMWLRRLGYFPQKKNDKRLCAF